MAHRLLYTFSVINGRVLQYKNNIQIARLHSFSYSKSKTHFIISGIATFYENLLACSNHDGTIVIIDIFTRRKRVIKIPKTGINTLTFLDEETLCSTSIDGLVKLHDLKTLRSTNITAPSLIALLKNKKEMNLEQLSSTILAPLIAKNSLVLAFELIDDNPFFKDTLEYNRLEAMYSIVFKQAIEELRKNNINKAELLLKPFINVISKKEEINSLFRDFKQYEQFNLHISQQNYSIAYAISSKHTLLELTPEFQKMEAIFLEAFKLAQQQMLMDKKDLAKETLSKYMTILSKRDEIKNLLNGNYIYKNPANKKSKLALHKDKLLLAYEKNNFKECYELIDKYSIKDLEIATLLEKHWIKLMIECEEYALDGNIKAIKTLLSELISTKTRVDKIGDLIRVAFHSKINTLQENKNFNSAENIIYSYIDIFGIDVEIKAIMKTFEKKSLKKLAITQNQNERILRDNWLDSEIIVEY